jgi:hypothetical protein
MTAIVLAVRDSYYMGTRNVSEKRLEATSASKPRIRHFTDRAPVYLVGNKLTPALPYAIRYRMSLLRFSTLSGPSLEQPDGRCLRRDRHDWPVQSMFSWREHIGQISTAWGRSARICLASRDWLPRLYCRLIVSSMAILALLLAPLRYDKWITS